MSRVTRRWTGHLVLCLGAAIACAGCKTFQDSAQIPGTSQRLVVGHHDGAFGSSATIWVEENGEFTEVEVVEAEAAPAASTGGNGGVE